MSRMKRAGVKMFFYTIFADIIAIFIGISIVLLFNIGKGMNLTALSSSSSSAAAQSVSFSTGDIIKGFIPDNFIKPFFEGNMIQLMVLAILIGIAAGASNSKIIASAFDEINKIFMKIIEIFLRFMPLLVFCSITSMFISTGTKTLLLVLGILLVFVVSNALIFVTYYLMVAFIARLNPAVMFRKSVSLMITAFTTCSSTAAISDGMKTSEQLGISKKIYSFLIPLGTLICKNAFCLFLSVLTLSTANMYGIEVSLTKIFLIIFYSILLPLAMPGMPGAGLIALSSLFALTGCPIDALSFAVMFDIIIDMLHTTIMVIGVLTSTLIVAKSENQFDIEKYKS